MDAVCLGIIPVLGVVMIVHGLTAAQDQSESAGAALVTGIFVLGL